MAKIAAHVCFFLRSIVSVPLVRSVLCRLLGPKSATFIYTGVGACAADVAKHVPLVAAAAFYPFAVTLTHLNENKSHRHGTELG